MMDITDQMEGKMESHVFIIDKKKRRIVMVTCGALLLAVAITFFIFYPKEKIFWLIWLSVFFNALNGISVIYLGLRDTLLFVKRDVDRLIVKWNNGISRKIIPIDRIDRFVLNDGNFELKLNNGTSMKFSCGNLGIQALQNLRVFLKKNFLGKII